MPTYQYACTACDERLEVVQKFSDDSLTECEKCGGRLRKVFSAAGIIFKGSGFYRTDSRSSGKSTAAVSSSNGRDTSQSAQSAQTSSSGSDSNGSSASAGSSSSSSSGSSSSPASSSSSTSSSSSSGSSKVA